MFDGKLLRDDLLTGRPPVGTLTCISQLLERPAPMSSFTPSHEWDTLGDTISHIASLPNAAPGVQQGFKDGYVDAHAVFNGLEGDQWATLLRLLPIYINGMHRVRELGRHTDEYASAYIAAVESVIALANASDTSRSGEDR